jgi:hypothetical protein
MIKKCRNTEGVFVAATLVTGFAISATKVAVTNYLTSFNKRGRKFKIIGK